MGSEYGQLIGHEIGHWRVVRLLGVGGFGAVYEAQHKNIAGRLAAIKVLHPQMLLRIDADELKRRFVNEASAASRADHENIVQVFDAGVAPDGICYVVMEFLRGSSLTQLLAQAGRLSIERVVSIGAQVASALAAAHNLNIVHRDLKPDNIFIVTRASNPDFVKVLDFGIAKLADSDVHTKTGAILGTPSYMSPEQWRSAPDLDGRSDLYSLGVILFECLTGQKPYQGNSLYELANAHVNESIPDPAAFGPIPEELRRIVMQLLAKRPEHRPASAEAVITALRSYTLSGVPITANSGIRSQDTNLTLPKVATSTPSDLTRFESAKEVASTPNVTRSAPDLAVTRLFSKTGQRRRWFFAGVVPILCAVAFWGYKGYKTSSNTRSPQAAGGQDSQGAGASSAKEVQPQSASVARQSIDEQPAEAGTQRTTAVAQALLVKRKSETPALPSDMVLFPEANFPIGATQGPSRLDFPKHTVHVKPFALGISEVSLGEFREYAEKTRAVAAMTWNALEDVGSMLRLPMNRVTRDQAAAYCAWRYRDPIAMPSDRPQRQGRLPTEDEWEYAAHSASPDTPYPWRGSEISIVRVNAGRKPPLLAPVDSFPDGSSAQGVRHLLGNVAEWTSSDAAPYPGSRIRVRAGAVVRGGSVTSNLGDLSVTARTIVPASTATPFLGFRCALDVE